jgi:hypothetical protein
MRIAIGVVSLSLVALVACGEPTAPGREPVAAATPGEVVYVADYATVLDDGQKVALCLGAIQTSLPPQCDGPRITNWSWDDTDDEESASGVTWGSYQVTGTYDGENFTLTEPPGPPTATDQDDTDFTAPCDEPDGGWIAPDPDMATDDDRIKTEQVARGESDYAEGWIDYLDDPTTEEEALEAKYILVLTFTGDLDRHEAVARETWGGPLCVFQHERTFKELRAIQDEVGDLGFEMLWSSIDVMSNTVGLGVVVATPEMLVDLEQRYGPGTVEVDAALRPLE